MKAQADNFKISITPHVDTVCVCACARAYVHLAKLVTVLDIIRALTSLYGLAPCPSILSDSLWKTWLRDLEEPAW